MSISEYKVIYSPEANEDLKAIYRYIAVDLGEKGNAKNQTERIRRKIHALTTFPEKYKAVDWKPWFYGGRDIQNLI